MNEQDKDNLKKQFWDAVQGKPMNDHEVREMTDKIVDFMLDDLMETIQSRFHLPDLKIDEDKLLALDGILFPVSEYDGGLTPEDNIQEYSRFLDIAMPIIRYVVPEAFVDKEQRAIYEQAKKHATYTKCGVIDERGRCSAPKAPVSMQGEVTYYLVCELARAIENPFMRLNENDLIMLAVYRLAILQDGC